MKKCPMSNLNLNINEIIINVTEQQSISTVWWSIAQHENTNNFIIPENCQLYFDKLEMKDP